ncbi:HAMP domain-containing sensor histidine kinase [Streptococcaceae bacterium ESL0729]|nr:HAMP domain-containing sensor histidine kinase [Streptococcaceae bacterium ESL0729]
MKKNDFRSFLNFFVAFTVIFVFLGAIIIQVLFSGLYDSTDANIEKLSSNPSLLVSIALQANSGSEGSDGRSSDLKPTGNFGTNETIIVYDSKGNILNPSRASLTDTVIFDSITFEKSSLNTIRSISLPNPYGPEMQFRTKTISVMGFKNISYIQILSSTNQLTESLSRSRMIIIWVMIAFWFVSLVASVYLSKWSNRILVDAYERQKSFVENASHELRTPLAILQNRLELLFQHPQATIIEESENISESLNEVRNMRILTSNLLNLAKGDEALEVHLTSVNGDFFENIFSGYEMLAEDRGKTFASTVSLANSVKIDESLIKQVLTILFDNALKYTGSDGHITAKVTEKNNYLVMTMTDNGEGISPENREKIFDRFYRVDKARTRATGGFGLGLSLAKQIVDRLHGKIQVSENTPKGSKFTVKLKV